LWRAVLTLACVATQFNGAQAELRALQIDLLHAQWSASKAAEEQAEQLKRLADQNVVDAGISHQMLAEVSVTYGHTCHTFGATVIVQWLLFWSHMAWSQVTLLVSPNTHTHSCQLASDSIDHGLAHVVVLVFNWLRGGCVGGGGGGADPHPHRLTIHAPTRST
jgi:hypothetical protein